MWKLCVVILVCKNRHKHANEDWLSNYQLKVNICLILPPREKMRECTRGFRAYKSELKSINKIAWKRETRCGFIVYISFLIFFFSQPYHIRAAIVYVVDYIVLYVQKKISLTYRPVIYYLFVFFCDHFTK